MTQSPVATIDNDAAEIAELFKRGKSMAVAAVLAHLECGRRLELKKEELGHGNWLPWLEANKETLGFGELAAQRNSTILFRGKSIPVSSQEAEVRRAISKEGVCGECGGNLERQPSGEVGNHEVRLD